MSTKSLPRAAPMTTPTVRHVTAGHLARRAWTAQAEIAQLRKDSASLTGTILHLEGQREKFEKAGDVGRARLQTELIALNQRRIDANDKRIAYLEGRE